MNKVEIIQPTKKVSNNRRKNIKGLNIDRIRVAAYCRVSTDNDDQLGSFESQKLYYEQKIKSNPDWINAGIFADEAITGTKVDKREDFLAMIQQCLDGNIDLILTKSISRFARNTLDTLQYVRLLRENNIAVFFEKENLNTLDMNGELLLTIMSSLAQQEVESLSKNVKIGLKMKMKRGELCGYPQCFGYDYDPVAKKLSINEEEAHTVRMIFDLYNQGYGCSVIASHMIRLGRRNRRGLVKWDQSAIRYIIKNEKYTGDVLLGKTFTVDPISKVRRFNNGEEEQYYIRDNHEPIISRDIWEQANKERLKRAEKIVVEEPGTRVRHARRYAFSGKCKCAFCGHGYVRKVLHSGKPHEKIVWQCDNYIKHRMDSCPNCKAVDENIIESAFIEAFNLLSGNYTEVVDLVVNTMEENISENVDINRVKRLEKDKSNLLSKKKRLTELLIEGVISKEDGSERFDEINRKLADVQSKKNALEKEVKKQKQLKSSLKEVRKILDQHTTLESFDREVFESIIDRVIIGGYNDDGTIDPYKLTFIMKGKQSAVVPDSKTQFKLKNLMSYEVL